MPQRSLMASRYKKRLSIPQWEKQRVTPMDIPQNQGVYVYKNEIYEHLDTHLTKSQKKILNHLIARANQYDRVFPAQRTIAEQLGVSYSTVCVAVKALKDMGYLASYYRVQDTCLYRIADIFYDPVIRWKLKDLFPALKFVHKVLLIPILFFGHMQYANTGETITAMYSDYSPEVITDRIESLYEPFFGKKETKGEESGESSMETNGRSTSFCEEASQKAQNMQYAEFNQRAICQLSAFDETALVYVDYSLSKAKGVIKDVFKWAVKVAKTYSVSNQLKVDYGRAFYLESKYSIAEQPHGILKTPTRNQPTKSPDVGGKGGTNDSSQVKLYKRLKDKYTEFDSNRTREAEYEQFERYKSENEQFATSMKKLRIRSDWNPFSDDDTRNASPFNIPTNQVSDPTHDPGAVNNNPCADIVNDSDVLERHGLLPAYPVIQYDDPYIRQAPINTHPEDDIELIPIYDEDEWEEVTDMFMEGID